MFRKIWAPSVALAAFAVSASLTLGSTSGNPGTVTVTHPENFSKVFAVSDIHGHLKHLTTLLQAAGIVDSDANWSAGNALLLVVGDSIDKGPDSIGTLDLWMKLTTQAAAAQGRLIHLLGNHEAEFLADPTKRYDDDDKPVDASAAAASKADSFIDEIQNKGIDVTTLTGTTSPRGAFLHAEPIAAAVGKWLFFHAGRYPKLSWTDLATQASAKLAQGNYGDPFFADDNSMLEAKDWWKDKPTRKDVESTIAQSGFFGIVFGHQPKAFEMDDKIGSIDKGKLIKIDSGMADSAGSNDGEILEFTQPSQLNQAIFPAAVVIKASGKTKTLTPESY